ncbi:hypothetical protein GE21DRAFT_2615 [Neurospora crassa]|uniref:DUF7918 domain-containing protein n=1 Tax=Neurospora crassa (strain ATCC 24698 / 74-OR23-1A / CBS 708.71 / DSM 1257 / FGSC 987) TaxID=367110 RepID=Q7SFJ0_NEUCR|nr:hypothetical protein NCU08631 [Neurospora crassa OR74A]EAA35603.3 hypothetical protein NCU08631 [Neurospora crassa OR74A]KHE81226.1 hypothetical protein GE21DRAFT_2615 [Neurospora crassa]|eukprot:XP_964839.3 hypothetical protein NCU08631 [Neurospora crassa OR74A]
MAILTGYPGLEVTIEVDGQRAQEYDAPADEVEARAKEIDFHSITHVPIQESGSPYTIKYIEAKPGKPFVFKLDSTNFSIPSHDGKTHMIEYKCFLDGIPTSFRRLACGTMNMRGSYTSGNNESGWKRHKFQFSTLELVEGAAETQGDRTKEYGTLSVKLWHAIDLCRTSIRMAVDDPVPVQSVSETVLKGKSVDSKVHFKSEPYISASKTSGRFDFVDPDRRPFAIFEFRYRTMEGLMSEGIVPRPVKNEDDKVIDLEDAHQVSHSNSSSQVCRYLRST